ncbi:MAG TPA: hypothetical protein VK115_09485 [Staphylococcus sp.]|nr:hypothetical protein [Staphylococcus sp.]
MKKHDPFDDLSQHNPTNKKSLRHMMVENDHFDSTHLSKKHYLFFSLLGFLLIVASIIFFTFF